MINAFHHTKILCNCFQKISQFVFKQPRSFSPYWFLLLATVNRKPGDPSVFLLNESEPLILSKEHLLKIQFFSNVSWRNREKLIAINS